MSASTDPSTIERIHASGKRIALAITGGGSGAIPALLEVPGASQSVVVAIVPYAQAALEAVLGGAVDHACSERTARALAIAAFEKAREFSAADPSLARGIGATASLASNRPKRGPHRVHVAWQSSTATVAFSCELVKGRRTRIEEEQVATDLILNAVVEACGISASLAAKLHSDEPLERREKRAPAAWGELLLGQCSAVWPTGVSAQEPGKSPPILFPGAFNPPHAGHLQMAEIAAGRYGSPVTFEISITNVDKPPLDFLEISDRLAVLAPHAVLLTRAPTFVEKASIAPGCVFVVGADTISRIADPRYYGNDAERCRAAITAIANQGCRFLVFGRQLKEQFQALDNLSLPAELRALCDEVPESAFRADVSSTQIRKS